MKMSDVIADFIGEMLSDGGGVAELQRKSLADRFSCVPSQINYVIETRFTPENGYLVESQRGGGERRQEVLHVGERDRRNRADHQIPEHAAAQRGDLRQHRDADRVETLAHRQQRARQREGEDPDQIQDLLDERIHDRGGHRFVLPPTRRPDHRLPRRRCAPQCATAGRTPHAGGFWQSGCRIFCTSGLSTLSLVIRVDPVSVCCTA